MGYRDRAVMALLCTALASNGCASKLDFDQVSAGRHKADAGLSDAGLSDAGLSGAGLRDASGAGVLVAADAAGPSDATVPALITPPDGPGPVVIGVTRADASYGTADAAVSDASVQLAPSLFSCATVSPQPYFCDDFESSALSSNWQVDVYPTQPVLGGAIEIDNSVSRAGHASLLAQINQDVSYCDNDCLGVVAGRWLRDLQGPTKLVTEFDLRVDQVDLTPSRRVALFQLQFGTSEAGFTEHVVYLESRGTSVAVGLIEYDTAGRAPGSTDTPALATTPHPFAATSALSHWVHVKYELDADDPSSTANVAKLSIDDVVSYGGPLQYALRTANVRMEIGVPWVDMSTFGAQDLSQSWRVRYDNVLVRSEPR